MIRRIYDWLYGWAITLRIKYRNPELYAYLAAPHSPDDFAEVTQPE